MLYQDNARITIVYIVFNRKSSKESVVSKVTIIFLDTISIAKNCFLHI